VVLFCAVSLTCPAVAATDPNELYFPFYPGNSWVFVGSGEETRRWDNEVEQSSATGLIEKIRIEETNEMICDHQATHVILFGNEQTPKDGSYYNLTDEGIIQYSDGNPNSGEWFECYDNGRLFLPNRGQANDKFSYSTPWHGQWDIPEEYGGGYIAWSGDVTGSITIMGQETVTVPAGTFKALKFKMEESNNKQVNEEHNNIGSGTQYFWLAKGVGPVKVEEWWEDETEWLNRGSSEHYVRELVAFSRGTEPNVPGQTVVSCGASGYASGGDANTQQAVADAMAAVADSMQTFQGGMQNNDTDAYGCLAGVLTMDADAVEQAVAAMAADGASSEQQFIRIEFAYDESELASLGLTESDLAPYWWDADRDMWVLVGTTTAGGKGAVMLATEAGHKDMVGYYGVDTANDVVWANVNHASMYGVGNVPEPASLALLAAGAIAILRRRR